MLEIHESIHVMLMLLAHVMRGAGTFTLEDKVKMIKFTVYVMKNTNMPLLDSSLRQQPQPLNRQIKPSKHDPY